MRLPRSAVIVLLSFLTSLLLPRISWPQLVIGQYEDEAPLRTWNTFGFSTAPSLAMGDTQFTTSSDNAASLSNPALLTGLPAFSLTFNSSVDTASMFKYSIVNTGVLVSDRNSSLSLLSLDFAGASIRIKGWAFAMSLSLLESYHRPRIKVQSSAMFNPYTLRFEQDGNLKNINVSAARSLFGRLSLGLGLNYAYGSLEKDIEEEWAARNITITDRKSHAFKTYYLNGGLVWDLTQKFKVAAVFRTSFIKKSDSDSLYRFYAPDENTDIQIDASGQSEYKQPFVAGLGISYTFSPRLKTCSEISFYKWSDYSIVYFGEEDELERDFKDTLKFGAGVEYMTETRILGLDIDVPFRAGFSYDPQPMAEPDSSYFYFSFGTGMHWRKFSFDAGMMIGKEAGSGNSLSAKRVALSLRYGI